jgi:hypothetical protein
MENVMADEEKIVPFKEESKAVVLSKETQEKGKVIKKLYNEVEKLAGSVVTKAIDLGNQLIGLREDIGHGGFMVYCTDELGLNYKLVQRYMQVAEYTPKLTGFTGELPSDLATALKETGKVKKAEEEARITKETSLFIIFRGDEEDYKMMLEGAPDAKAATQVKKPIAPWAKDDDSRNISNRYKSWLSKKKKLEAPPEEDDEEEVTLDELVESAYQRIMVIFDKLSPEQLIEAIATLQDRLSEGDRYPE